GLNPFVTCIPSSSRTNRSRAFGSPRSHFYFSFWWSRFSSASGSLNSLDIDAAGEAYDLGGVYNSTVMSLTLDYEELPSGKRIVRKLDADGRLISEAHSYGLIDISITSHFSAGVKTAETYIINKRLVSRKRYDKARQGYADMPASDSNVHDVSGE